MKELKKTLYCNINFINKPCDLFDESLVGVQKIIIPVNAQIIALTGLHKNLFELFDNAYNILDGQIPFLMQFLTPSIKDKVNKLSGVDFINYLIFNHLNPGETIYLCGGAPESNTEAILRIKNSTDLNVLGSSPVIDDYGKPINDPCLIDNIINSNCRVLLVGFGFPKQELFLNNYYEILAASRIEFIVACGGTIDFLSGKFSRCPKFISIIGFEWLYRTLVDLSFKRLRRLFQSLMFFYVWLKS